MSNKLQVGSVIDIRDNNRLPTNSPFLASLGDEFGPSFTALGTKLGNLAQWSSDLIQPKGEAQGAPHWNVHAQTVTVRSCAPESHV